MNPVTDIPGLGTLVEQTAGGSPDIRIAVIDGPVDANHPAFLGTSPDAPAPLIVQPSQYDLTRSTHGTHVASVIAGQPGSPVAGIAPRCTVLCIPVYREDSEGNLVSCAQTTLARAIHHALDSGATIINISGGQFTPTGQGDRFLEAAVQQCAQRNALIVAAAGNDGCRCLHVPAALPSVLAVGACDRDGKPMPFSNYGDAYRDNGILAPGDAIPGAGPGGSASPRSGTSFATPIVTAVAALLLSLRRQLGDELDAHAIRRLLLDTAAPLDPQFALDQGPAGVLDVESAMAALQRTAPSGAPQSRENPTPRVVATATPSTSPLPQAAGGALSESSLSNNQLTGEANAMSANYQTPGHAPASILGPDGAPLSGVGPSTAMPSDPGQPQVAPYDAGAAEATSASAPGAASPAEAPAPAATAVVPAPATAIIPAQSAPPAPGPSPVMPQGLALPAMAPQVPVPQPVAPQAAEGWPGGMPTSAPPAAIAPSQSCSCAGVQPSQAMGESAVFVIGRLFYDFESEARFDYFVQAIAEWRKRVNPEQYDPSGDYAAPWNPQIMIQFLLYKEPKSGVLTNFPDSNALIWTVNIDTAPIYAIKPHSAFGLPMYMELATLLWQQECTQPITSIDDVAQVGAEPKDKSKKDKKKPPVERVSQAGYVDGEIRLMNGTVVPQLLPVWRGMFGWNITDIAGDDPPDNFKEFLERIYNQFRNVGVSPQDRAMNYSAFNAYNTKKIFEEMAHSGMFLDTVSVDRSTICRPDSDCWDATWTFFNPKETLTTARHVFQYTVDVSDVVPVTVGPLRDWSIF